MESNSSSHASDALSLVSGARAAAADRLVTPWWYHPILGLLIGSYFLASSLGDRTVQLIAAVVMLGGVGILVAAYKRLTGVWISGFRAGRASRWSYAIAAVLVIAIIAGSAVASSTSRTWPYWVTAVAMAVAVVLMGRRFDVALRAQLRERV